MKSLTERGEGVRVKISRADEQEEEKKCLNEENKNDT